jgi:hypothetical protein
MAGRNSNLRWGIMLPIGSPAPADSLGTLAWQVLKLVRRMGLLLVQNLEPAGLDETEQAVVCREAPLEYTLNRRGPYEACRIRAVQGRPGCQFLCPDLQGFGTSCNLEQLTPHRLAGPSHVT